MQVLNLIEDDDVLDSYTRTMLSLQQKGFSNDMDTLWTTLPMDGIRLMVNVWLTRPADRAYIAHPTPTATQAMNVIHSVPYLSLVEKQIVQNLIRVAINTKTGDHLFDASS